MKNGLFKMARSHFKLQPLSPAGRSTLEAFLQQTARKSQVRLRKRGNAIWLASQGQTVQKISRVLGVSERSIWNWLHNYQQKGMAGIMDQPVRHKLTQEQIGQLIKLRYPFLPKNYREDKSWSYRRLSEWVRENWQVVISSQRLVQIMHQWCRTLS